MDRTKVCIDLSLTPIEEEQIRNKNIISFRRNIASVFSLVVLNFAKKINRYIYLKNF